MSHCPVLTGWEGVRSRKIRESEDLPGFITILFRGNEGEETGCNPDEESGFFFIRDRI
jgi:hypothetical protein